MDTNALLALNANLQIEAAMEEILDDRRGMKRQVIIDLETSGLTPETGDIIRFRAVNRWDPDDEFDEPVKPPRPLAAEAESITGTTNERLAHCRSIAVVLADFLDFIDGAELLGDNLEFDLKFLEAAAAAMR